MIRCSAVDSKTSEYEKKEKQDRRSRVVLLDSKSSDEEELKGKRTESGLDKEEEE